MDEAALALEMLDITKTFPGVRALDEVSFACGRGEVHALCGENGAGKSTLIKILGGVYQPDGGTIRLDGREVAFSHPLAARRAGISIIHQELSLLPNRSVAENIFLGVEPTRFGLLDRRTMREEARRLLRRLGSLGRVRFAGRRSFHRPPADRRDRQGARDRRPHSGHGRADRRSRPRRRCALARSGQEAQRRARLDRLRLSPDARDSGGRRSRHRAQGREDGHDRPARGSADQPARPRDGRPRSLRLLPAAFA